MNVRKISIHVENKSTLSRAMPKWVTICVHDGLFLDISPAELTLMPDLDFTLFIIKDLLIQAWLVSWHVS